jgi:hypothetical protein
MARRITGPLALCAVAACLAWADWPGPAARPATLIGRVDVIATVVALALVPRLMVRRFGPAGRGWRPRLVRLCGYAAVVALVLVKTHVERSDIAFPTTSGALGLAGVWAGEALFLVVMAAYIGGLAAVTSQRPVAGRVAVATGVAAGAVAGLIMYALPPRAGSLHLTSTWMADVYEAARVAAVPLVLGAGIFAGVRAARRSRRHDGRLPTVDSRARQGMAAGICAGVAAALVVSILGISTIALAPHEAAALVWTLPGVGRGPASIYDFEVSLSEAGAGYLLVLLFFPVLGAGLGAWGGLYGADRPGRQSGGGGGGGGPDGPDRQPPPSPGGRTLESPASGVVDIREILGMPEWDPATPVREGPARREKVPLGPPGQD